MIDIDTLRPDHMGCYGYERNTTPHIDALAADAVRFENYYCSDAPCLPSRAALVTGRFGIHNGAVGHGGTVGDRRLTGASRGFRDSQDTHNFHNLFRQAGMYTASISTFAERHSSWWFNAGFQECINVGGCGMESGEEILPEALGWLQRNRDRKDFFLHIHFWDPHTPYRAPEAFGNPFADEPAPAWITEEVFQLHRKHPGPHGLNELNLCDDRTDPAYPRMRGKAETYAEMKQVIDGYDCGVRYTDELVGKLLEWLKEAGLYEETAVILTSDHGENMGELGIYAEHATADEPTCHIPMILKWPGGQKGTVDRQLHYHLDLVPTTADLLGLKHFAEWDGKSYAKSILTGAECGRDALVLSQMAHVCQRSVRFGEWLYIRTIHDGYHLFDREMLFRISEDPHEQKDVKGEFPEVCGQAARILLDWQEEQMQCSDSAVDPMWTVVAEGGPLHAREIDLNRYLKRLEETGRKEGADRLRAKYIK